MVAVRLHFPGENTQALCLSEGVHGIGWRDGRLGVVGEHADAWLTLSVNRSGMWVKVSDEAACVHLNGRRIHRVAWLRSGDIIHLDRAELRLVSAPETQAQPLSNVIGADPRLVVRALGGPDHGRCFTLNRPLLAGRGSKADLRIDDPACSERHAWLERGQGQDQLLLRHSGKSAHSLVNGQPRHEAVLAAGDQIAFTPRHRFVIEAPDAPLARAPNTPPPHAPILTRRPRALRSLLWLLATAAVFAALLAGLLLFGVA